MGLVLQGQIPTLTIAGRVFTDLANLKILFGSVDSGGVYTTCRLGTGTTGYAVSAGKTLTLVAMKYICNIGAAGGILQILYGDTDLGVNSAGPPINGVFQSSQGTLAVIAGAITANTTPLEQNLNFAIPTGKYVTTKCTASFYCSLYGYEA